MAIVNKINLNGTEYDIVSEKASQDESGNNIKASYASSMELSEGDLLLKNKNGETLSTVDLPTGKTYTATKGSVGSASEGTAISINNISAWSAGSPTEVTVTGSTLNIIAGTAPSLTYAATSIPNISVASTSVVTDVVES